MSQQIREVVVATDLSEASKQAMDYAKDMAESCNANLTLLYVYPEGGFADPGLTEQEELKRLDEAQSKLNTECEVFGSSCKAVTFKGSPQGLIVDYTSNNNCDILVIGNHNLQCINKVLTGSVTDYILHEAKCPVLRC